MTRHEYHVALASCRELPEPDPDAAPLALALRAAGIEAAVLAWDDPRADWSRAPLTVLRSTWNYPTRRAEFLAWAERAAATSDLWNPLPVVRWNTHKAYLLELERQGVPIAPTLLLPRGSTVTLDEVLGPRGWREVVLKPAVSAASRGTRRFGPREADAGEQHLRRLLEDHDVLLQRYLPSVEGHGERALVWIDGELTHAVRKRPRFEGEDESVSTASVPISPAEARLARRVIETVGHPLLYARVDVAPGALDEPLLMELELVEPSLFFLQCPPALERFVAAIRLRLEARGPT